MPFNQSAAAVERSLREFVRHLLPRPSPKPSALPIDRTFRGWLRREVVPRVLAFLAVIVIVRALFQVVDLLFAPRLVWCSESTPQGAREMLCGIDFWPYGDIDEGIFRAY